MSRGISTFTGAGRARTSDPRNHARSSRHIAARRIEPAVLCTAGACDTHKRENSLAASLLCAHTSQLRTRPHRAQSLPRCEAQSLTGLDIPPPADYARTLVLATVHLEGISWRLGATRTHDRHVMLHEHRALEGHVEAHRRVEIHPIGADVGQRAAGKVGVEGMLTLG